MKDKEKTLNSIQNANRKAIIFIVLGFTALVFISFFIYTYFFSSTLYKSEESVYFAILFVDDDKKPYGAFIGTISGIENRMGFIGIPQNMGLWSESHKEPMSMHEHYIEGRERQVFDSIAYSFKKDITYRITLDNKAIKDVVDLMGGVRMYIESEINFVDAKKGYRLNFPIGEYLFTSDKILAYLNYMTLKGFEARETLFRLEDVLINILISFIQDPQQKEKILSRGFQRKISTRLKSNLRRADLIEFAGILSRSSSKSFIVESMDGSYDAKTEMLVPILEGRAAIKQLDNLSEYVAFKTERAKLDNESVNLLVLNATEISGLADSINIRMRYKGFLAGEYGNFVKPLDKSVIFIRSGQIEKAFLVAKESNIDRVYASTDRRVLNDAVMALGYDYYEIKR